MRWSSGLKWNGFVPDSTPTKMPQLRVLLNFANEPDHALEERAMAVHGGLYGKPAFPSPPVTQAALLTGITNFSTAIAAAEMGGPADTAAKNNMREILIGLLRQLATYVQENHGNNLATLLSSGFEAASTNSTSVPLETPSIKDIINGNSGQLILRVEAVENARGYHVRYALIGANGAPGPYIGPVYFKSTRRMEINDLTPGGNYVFEVCALGGSTGESDWSNPVSHMSL
jgi:hypothetical protein